MTTDAGGWWTNSNLYGWYNPCLKFAWIRRSFEIIAEILMSQKTIVWKFERRFDDRTRSSRQASVSITLIFEFHQTWTEICDPPKPPKRKNLATSFEPDMRKIIIPLTSLHLVTKTRTDIFLTPNICSTKAFSSLVMLLGFIYCLNVLADFVQPHLFFSLFGTPI